MTAAAAPRVVVVKLAALGDLVMASTLVHGIRTRWPQAHLTWVTGEPLAPLARRLDGITRVIAVDTHALLGGSLPARVRVLLQAWRALGRTPYDLGVVAHKDRRYAALLWGARVRTRRHFPDRVAAPGVTAPGVATPDAPRGEWMGAAYARLLTQPGEPEDAPQLAPVHLTSEERAQGAAAAGAVLLAPGGARNVLRDDALRRWPVAHWVQLAQALRAQGHRLVVVGSAADVPEAHAVTQAVPDATNLVGHTSLLQLVALVAQARLVVCHDSGPMHLAALTRTPTVALFGPTAPEERIPPGVPMVAASAAAGLACAPCYDGVRYAPCTRNRCLADLSVARVLALAGSLLRAPDPAA
jgi:heptosyltransferase-2